MNLALVSEGIFLEQKTYSEMDDQELMQLLVAENLSAWSELVKRYGNLVYTIAYQVLNNNSDTEDAVQNTFVRLKIYSGKFDHTLPLKPWLSQIASGEAIRIYNKKKNINKKESSRMEPQNYSIPSQKQDVSEVAAQKEIEVMVKKAIELLPEISRVAITLYYVGGMSQTEIAKELGLSQFSISEKIKMGLEKVKLHLKKAGVHASVVISPLLVQESLTLNSLPQELSVKLAQSLPTNAQLASVSAIKTKASFTLFSTKLLMVSLACLVTFLTLGGIYWQIKSKGKPLVSSPSEVVRVPTLILGKNNVKPNSSLINYQENKFYPINLNNYIPVKTKFVKFKRDEKVPDVMEGEAQVIGGDLTWQVKANAKTGDILLRENEGREMQDGLYFNQEFKQPHIFKGKLKINSKRCKFSLIMSTPMIEDKFNQIEELKKEDMVYSSHTCNVSTLMGDTGNLVEFKVYIWINKGKLLSACFVDCKGFPKSLVSKSIPLIKDEFKFGLLSNGKVEITNIEFCPLSKDWDFRTEPDLLEKLNEFPKDFFEGTIASPKDKMIKQDSAK